MSRHTVVIAVAAALAAAAFAAAAGLLLLGGGERASEQPASEQASSEGYVSEHPVAIPEELRTVVVSTALPMPSAHERRLSVALEAGELPSGPVLGEVLTDTDCVPDEQMISRCRNEVRLDDGSTIVLRHPHDMTKVPCLAPGERVRLLPTT